MGFFGELELGLERERDKKRETKKRNKKRNKSQKKKKGRNEKLKIGCLKKRRVSFNI